MHYDCSNCGERRGLAWGFCRACTPREVLDVKEELQEARESAECSWDTRMKAEKIAFINTEVKKIQAKHDALIERLQPQ